MNDKISTYWASVMQDKDRPQPCIVHPIGPMWSKYFECEDSWSAGNSHSFLFLACSKIIFNLHEESKIFLLWNAHFGVRPRVIQVAAGGRRLEKLGPGGSKAPVKPLASPLDCALRHGIALASTAEQQELKKVKLGDAELSNVLHFKY